MLSLPNFREYNNTDLVESPNDSEALLTVKFAEQMKWRWEVCEARECAECEVWEAREQAEHEERAERDACERQSQEERERSAREEVRRGKVSAGRCV